MKVSERGVWLIDANNNRQNSNIKHGKVVVVGQDNSGDDIKTKIGNQCPKCKFRVRGMNHANGAHHNGTVASRSR